MDVEAKPSSVNESAIRARGAGPAAEALDQITRHANRWHLTQRDGFSQRGGETVDRMTGVVAPALCTATRSRTEEPGETPASHDGRPREGSLVA